MNWAIISSSGKTVSDPVDILVIGDAHSHPDYDNNRFVLAGRLARELKVDIVVSMGDWADVPSLVTHNRGTRMAEGRRLEDDIEVAHDAGRMFAKGLGKHRPELYEVTGNHEERLDRYAASRPELSGHMGSHLLHREGWEHIPFLDYFEVNGVYFTHYIPNNMGRAISGKNLAERIVQETGVPTVVGHSHFYQHTGRPADRPTGNKKPGMVAGMFGHADYKERWCIGGEPHWWRGVVLLAGVQNGNYDARQYSLEWMKGNL